MTYSPEVKIIILSKEVDTSFEFKWNWLKVKFVARVPGSFEILIIGCQIDFINLFILHCLTLNVKFFIFKLFEVNFFCSKFMSFGNTREGCLWIYGRGSFVWSFKLTRENHYLLSSRHKKSLYHKTSVKSNTVFCDCGP